MSTNVTRTGRTVPTRRSSRLLGVAAVGLAAVIALGFVFAFNQGNEATSSGVQPAHPMVVDAHRAKTEVLADRALARSTSPGANIERFRLEQAGVTSTTESPGANIERFRLEQAGVTSTTESPGTNIERFRLEQANN